jgi:4-azaleucine resistance transporter AzlC
MIAIVPPSRRMTALRDEETATTMTTTDPTSATHEFRAGAVAILPAAVAVIPFGLLLGALAAQKGFSALEVALMSALVFAGASQFIAVEIWREPAPWALLGLTALTVNLRHVMMGASVVRHMRGFGAAGRPIALFFLADEVWAMAERRALERGGGLHWAFYAGLASVLYASWVAWTVAGTALGALIANPAAWGFDFAFTAIFIGLIAAFWKGGATALVVAAAAGTAILIERTVGGVWHILAGGLAGMVAAALLTLSAREARA